MGTAHQGRYIHPLPRNHWEVVTRGWNPWNTGSTAHMSPSTPFQKPRARLYLPQSRKRTAHHSSSKSICHSLCLRNILGPHSAWKGNSRSHCIDMYLVLRLPKELCNFRSSKYLEQQGWVHRPDCCIRMGLGRIFESVEEVHAPMCLWLTCSIFGHLDPTPEFVPRLWCWSRQLPWYKRRNSPRLLGVSCTPHLHPHWYHLLNDLYKPGSKRLFTSCCKWEVI